MSDLGATQRLSGSAKFKSLPLETLVSVDHRIENVLPKVQSGQLEHRTSQGVRLGLFFPQNDNSLPTQGSLTDDVVKVLDEPVEVAVAVAGQVAALLPRGRVFPREPVRQDLQKTYVSVDANEGSLLWSRRVSQGSGEGGSPKK